MTDLTPADIREIAAASGLNHAEFCIEQEVTQIGREAAEPLYAELARLQAEHYAENEASIRDEIEQ